MLIPNFSPWIDDITLLNKPTVNFKSYLMENDNTSNIMKRLL